MIGKFLWLINTNGKYWKKYIYSSYTCKHVQKFTTLPINYTIIFMKTYLLYISTLFVCVNSLSSCVTAKRYDDMAARARQAEISKAECEEKIALLDEDKKKAEAQIQSLTSLTARLREDSIRTQDLYNKNKV